MLGHLVSAAVGAAVGYLIGHRQGAKSSFMSPLSASSVRSPLMPPNINGDRAMQARSAFCQDVLDKEHRPDKLYALANLWCQDPQMVNHAMAFKNKADEVIMMGQAAADLVERSRTGDQQSWAMIEVIGEEARNGSPRAQLSASLIEQYCKLNPAPDGMVAPEMPNARVAA